jgi:hypothetical protein
MYSHSQALNLMNFKKIMKEWLTKRPFYNLQEFFEAVKVEGGFQ